MHRIGRSSQQPRRTSTRPSVVVGQASEVAERTERHDVGHGTRLIPRHSVRGDLQKGEEDKRSFAERARGVADPAKLERWFIGLLVTVAIYTATSSALAL